MTLNVTGSLVNPAAAVKTLNSDTQIEIVQRRPILSASVPRNIAPNIIPNSAELAMKPAVEASTPMSFMMRRQRDAGDRQVVAVDDDDQHTPRAEPRRGSG